MKLNVYVHPNSKSERIEQTDKFEYAVYFNVVPEGGKANKKMIEMLAQNFNVPKSSVIIRAGEKSKVKIVEVLASR